MITVASDKRTVGKSPERIAFILSALGDHERSLEDYPVISLLSYLLDFQAPVRSIEQSFVHQNQIINAPLTAVSDGTVSSFQHGKERWHCPGCNTISTKATDQRLEEGVAKLLEQLRNTPKMVEFGQESREIPLNEIDSKETSFQKLLDTHNFDEALAKSLALDLAATRFNNLSTREYETMRIQNFLENNLTEETTDLTLLHEIADAVLIYPDGQVCLRLKNEQIIGGMI